MSPAAELDLTREGVLANLPMPLTLRLAVPMTDEELIAFSCRNRPWQIERNAEGELEIMSPVGTDGSGYEAFVIGELYQWAKQHGGRAFSSNAAFTLSDSSVRSPDVSWIADERIRALTPEQRRGFAPTCPEFLVQILSESDSRPKLERKMKMWIAAGARLAWLIDPFQTSISIYRPNREPEVLNRPRSITAGEPVRGFYLDTAEFWAD